MNSPGSRPHVETVIQGELICRITHPGSDKDRFTIDTVMRVTHGVQFLRETLPDRPDMQVIFLRCMNYGEFSARPYHPGQATDDSTLNCVLALYYDLCRRKSLNATELMVSAHPEIEFADHWVAVTWRKVLDAAHWQGTHFPDTWSDDAILRLLISLRSQGRTQLARRLAAQLNLQEVSSDESISGAQDSANQTSGDGQ